MEWILPALLAPLLWAIVNLLDDNLVRHVYKGALAGSVISGLFGLIPAILILVFARVDIYIDPRLILIISTAGFLNVVSFFFYFKALQRADPSVVVALFALTPAILPLLAYFIVDERLSTWQIIGFSTIILASIIYSMTDVKRFKFSPALIPALIAAGIFDVVSLANKFVFDRVDFYQAYLYFSFGMFLAGLYFMYLLIFQNNGKDLKGIIRKNSKLLLLLLALVEVIGLSADYVRNYALSIGPLSLVKAFENTQILYVLVISVLLYPLVPKWFPEAKAGKMTLKICMGLVIIAGVYMSTLDY